MSEEATLDEFGDTDVDLLSDEPQGIRLAIDESYPESWRFAELDRVCKVNSGFSWSKEQETDSPENDAVPVIKIGNVQDGYLNLTDTLYLEKVSDKSFRENRARKNWLLMIGSNGSGERVGHCGLIEEDMEFVYASFLYGLHADSDYLLPRYLFYNLNRPKVQRRLTSFTAGSTSLKNLNKSTISNLSVPTPPLEEQRKIATVLYTVDRAIQKTEEIINCTERLRKEVLDELFASGYGKHEQQTGYIGPREVEYPSSWTSVELGALTDKITKGKTPTSYGYNYTSSGINFIKAESISQFGGLEKDKFEHIQEDAHEHLSGSKLQRDDVLLSIAGALGKVTQVSETVLPANTNQALALIRIDDSRVLPEYIRYYLETTNIQKYIQSIATTTAQSNLNLKQVSEFKILLPPIEEQREMLKIISDVEARLENEYGQKESLSRLKQGLMQDLLSGAVRIHDTDIDILDEVLAHG